MTVSRIEQARQRLAQAIGRLETAVERREGAHRAEVTQLRQTVAALEARCTHLDEVTGQVARRLDGTISRVQTVLDEEDGAQ